MTQLDDNTPLNTIHGAILDLRTLAGAELALKEISAKRDEIMVSVGSKREVEEAVKFALAEERGKTPPAPVLGPQRKLALDKDITGNAIVISILAGEVGVEKRLAPEQARAFACQVIADSTMVEEYHAAIQAKAVQDTTPVTVSSPDPA